MASDSSTALSIMRLLQGMAKKGMIILCSIHQPRTSIFSVFDKVLLLDKGRTVYYGARESVVSYFNGVGQLELSHARLVQSIEGGEEEEEVPERHAHQWSQSHVSTSPVSPPAVLRIVECCVVTCGHFLSIPLEFGPFTRFSSHGRIFHGGGNARGVSYLETRTR